jgi:hypothetical protein
VQEQTPLRRLSLLRPAGLLSALLLGVIASASLAAKDIGILVDRSLSVDQANRDEAVKLIEGLMAGKVDDGVRGKWRLIDETWSEDDPGQREMRQKELTNLRTLAGGQNGEALASGKYRLFLGDFGDLETVKKLASVEWRGIEGDVGPQITKWASEMTPTDKETHFELARATAASRLGAADEFYFFVVSDGVEDLVNWPATDYLDPAKLKDPAALEKGDFRDRVKARTLEMMNLKRQSGEDLVVKGSVRPGYTDSERGTLSSFKKNFSERLLGRFALSGPELKTFFGTHPGKVPVNVYIYSARPKGSLTVRFTTPADSSQQSPHPISLTSSNIKWKLDLPAGESANDYHLDLAIHEPSSNSELALKPVQGDGCALFDVFPDLKNGEYELRLAAAKPGGKPVRSSAFVSVKRSAPSLAFVDEFEKATDRPVARHFDPRRDDDILGQKIAWKWTSDTPELGAPIKLDRALAFFDEDAGETKPRLETVAPLSPGVTSLPLGQLLTGGDQAEEPLPLGGTYRLTLRAEWPDHTRATATAWFVLPEPNLAILGKSTVRESAETPRAVEKDETIKIGNWMHRWENFSYKLNLFRKEGSDWQPLEGTSTEWPLQLENKSSSGALIRVTKSFPGELKYQVTFGPENDAKREVVDCPLASGFVQGTRFSILPWILGGLGGLTLLFFGWNLLRRK